MKKFLEIIGPGLLVAATGVGAGDLATSALAGSNIGIAAVSAVVVGGLIKFILNEGLARWQYHSGQTILESSMSLFGAAARWFFLFYLIIWTFTVAVALMSATGAAFYAILPIFDPGIGKIGYGVFFSLVGYGFVRIGGFAFFQKLMTGAVVIMLIAVFYSVLVIPIDRSLTMSSWIPTSHGLSWYLAVMGGVGGTVTILCYGYWIKAAGRTVRHQGQTQIDLGVSYFITVLLGVAMVLIGTNVQVTGGGAGLLVSLSAVLDQQAGPLAGWTFRVGAFAAIFSSLLGVWQSVPFLFLDVMKPLGVKNGKGSIYNKILLVIAVIPMVGLPIGFASMQKAYAVCGAAFVPILASTLLVLHYQKNSFRLSITTIILLAAILLLFVGLFLQLIIPFF